MNTDFLSSLLTFNMEPMLLINRLEIRDLIMDFWGMPDVWENVSDLKPLTCTYCEQSAKHNLRHCCNKEEND